MHHQAMPGSVLQSLLRFLGLALTRIKAKDCKAAGCVEGELQQGEGDGRTV